MTDKDKRELKDGVISIFKRFNILDHTATIGGLRDDILRYIDSLQEESKFKVGDKIRLKGTTVKGDTIIKIYTSEVGNTYFEFKNSGVASADLDWELVEEPKKCMYTKDDFTEEDRKILCEDCDEKCEYSKKEEPVSEDLGEYINELSKQFPEVSFAKLSRIAVRVAKWQKEQFEKECADMCNGIASLKGLLVSMTYRRGVADGKEQIMKDATETIVKVDAGGFPYIPQIELYDYDNDVPLAKEGEKYKVILIKED